MNLSLSRTELCSYTCKQINNFFPDGKPVKNSELSPSVDLAIDRLDFCFKEVAFERYNTDENTIFNHLYADQYLMFLWLLSKEMWLRTNLPVANKIYYLNKALHSFDCMYDTRLPDIFLVFHGAGTMLGKADYSDYMVVLQGCTVGSQKGIYPSIGLGVSLTSHSSIIGNCKIGDRASISANTSIFETDIPDDSVAFSSASGALQVKRSNMCYSQQFYKVDLKAV